MTTLANPYANALEGLELADPVAAFFELCRERERIRLRREGGVLGPWSEDPIFQRGRFLNVFREDDRGSKAIVRFAGPLADDLNALVHALFFARWCNRQSTLDVLSADQLGEPERLEEVLQTLPSQPWCNVTAYPVEPVRWEGTLHSRLATATTLFGRIAPLLTDAIRGARRDVVKATRAVNELLGMENDFPIFMAVIDLAWFRPDVIDPGSPVPTGIGAAPFLDLLQGHLGLASHQETCARMVRLQADHWPEAKRPFQPVDIEYLACECRKYFSYVQGTKGFEGKNVFVPGESARLTFDIGAEGLPAGEIATRIRVIAGGPCSGKTTLLRALQQAGHRVEWETAERVLEAGIAAGGTAAELKADPVAWQREMLRQDHALFDGLPVDEPVFTDTSFIETVVFAGRAGLALGPNVDAWLRWKRYEKVFFLAPLKSFERTAVRMESHAVALQISEQVRQRYRQHGYDLVVVPDAPVAERVAFIRAALA
jgi:predicted ATPase